MTYREAAGVGMDSHGEADMGERNIKTEHGGPKHGKGYWGKKVEAKKVSNKARRKTDRKLAKKETT